MLGHNAVLLAESHDFFHQLGFPGSQDFTEMCKLLFTHVLLALFLLIRLDTVNQKVFNDFLAASFRSRWPLVCRVN